jgi:2,3-bisphosphoglycerate-dependent phosphoglycerate mutase
MELILVRHALPVRRENEPGAGAADPELSPQGHEQAAHLATYLSSEHIDAVYASTMQRAKQTAAHVADTVGLEVVLDDELAEWDRNSHWYVPIEELKATNDPRWQQMLQGETFAEVDPATFQAIVVRAVERVIAAHPGKRVVAVCHGGVINAYLSHVLGLGDATGFFYPNYTSIHRVLASGTGERTILSLNETSHLRGTGLPVGLYG